MTNDIYLLNLLLDHLDPTQTENCVHLLEEVVTFSQNGQPIKQTLSHAHGLEADLQGVDLGSLVGVCLLMGNDSGHHGRMFQSYLDGNLSGDMSMANLLDKMVKKVRHTKDVGVAMSNRPNCQPGALLHRGAHTSGKGEEEGDPPLPC